MNIITEKFVNAINIAICIFPSREIKNPELKEKMMEFTKFYALRINQLMDEHSVPIYITTADSIDHGLNKYAARFNHILFMAAGAKIHDMSVIFDIRDAIAANPNYLVAAHILDWGDQWYQLHEQFVMVNCRKWLSIPRDTSEQCVNSTGQPMFGTWTPATALLPVIERSPENFHHDYTPLWIKFTGEWEERQHSKPGWNFIRLAAKHGFDIINWNEDIRRKRTYYYPETDGDQLLASLKSMRNEGCTNPNQLQLIRSLTSTKDQIWLLNSEDMTLPPGRYSTIAMTASGFKYLEAVNKQLLYPNGRMIIYDFNPRSLQWIEHLYTSTSIDIPQLVIEWHNKDAFKILGGPVCHEGGSHLTEHFLASFQRTVDFFGGREQFVTLLQQWRKTPVEFVEVNLFEQPATLADLFRGATLLNISNIFCTDFSNAYFGQAKTQAAFDNLIESITVPVTVIGHDVLTRPLHLTK
jgi:hypothetical protein